MSTALRNNIDWVGYVDWNVRDFHGYETSRGATYNAYLIRDEKTALIDTVKVQFAQDLLAHISEFCDPVKIDYIICNHAEPDHTGALPTVIKTCGNPTIVCDEKCRKVLSQYFDTTEWNFHIVKTGDSLSLGKRTLQFIETPMVHWPESMFTYVPEEKLLFSMDAFGQHIATSRRFDDENSREITLEEAKIYYANIVMLYGKRVSAVLQAGEGMDIEMIAPSHGVIWRSYVKDIIGAYNDWVTCRAKAKALICYDTMWNSTSEMAEAIYDGAKCEDVDVKLMNIRKTGLTMLATEFLDCAAVAFGSPTLNQGMMPMAAAALTYIKGLRPTGKAGFAFGSYGWSKGGAEAVEQFLKDMKFDIIREPLNVQYRPTKEDLDQCREAGKLLAKLACEIAEKEAREASK